MAELEYFRVTLNGIGAIGVDYVDAGVDPDEDAVYPFVDFKPRLDRGTVIYAPNLTIPRGIMLDDVRGRLDHVDGKLRTIIASPTNERQTITVTGDPFVLNFNGQPTANISSTALPSAVAAAIIALPNVDDVGVTGETGGPYTVQFKGTLAGTDVPQMTATNATINTTTQGDLAAGVWLVANTPVISVPLAAMGYDKLIYDIEFTIPASDRTIASFAIEAPTTGGSTIDLASATRLKHKSLI